LNEAGWCCGDLAIQIDFRAFGGRAVIQRTSLQCPSLDPEAVMGRPADHRFFQPIQIFRAEEKQRRRNENLALRKAERDAAKASPDDKQS
jgi:hypothetical protein